MPSVLSTCGVLALSAVASAYSVGPTIGHAAANGRCAAHLAQMKAPLTVGVLAIQGGFAEHVQALERHSNVEAVEVRTSSELAGSRRTRSAARRIGAPSVRLVSEGYAHHGRSEEEAAAAATTTSE